MSLSDNSFTPELIVKNIQLKVRGLRHASPEDLQITLSHVGRSVVVMREGRLANQRLRFGAESSSSFSSSSAYTLSPQKAFDYIFDDESLGQNLALVRLQLKSLQNIKDMQPRQWTGTRTDISRLDLSLIRVRVDLHGGKLI